MKYILPLLVLFICSQAKAQNKPATPSNDSLVRYCERLERNEFEIYKKLKSSGKDISIGADCLGGGIAAALLGAVITSLGAVELSKSTSTNGTQGPKINLLEGAGIGIGAVGIGFTIYGITRLGNGGRKLKEL